MRLIIFFLVLSTHVSAQDLKYIPDINLRNALTEQGFTTNDSLDLYKTRGRLQLNLNGKGIVNLDGLQHFERMRFLSLLNNKIESLDYLPPNLESLSCHNNNIKEIENLPSNLKHINFFNNKMTYFPKLPEGLESINYSHNPIPFDSIPLDYQRISCDNFVQNCLPYKFIKWNIFDANMKKTSQNITGMKIKLMSETYSIGSQKEIEILNFKVIGSKLILDTSQLIKSRGGHNNAIYSDEKYTIKVSKVKEIIDDIYNEKMSFKFLLKNNEVSIDLNDKKNGWSLETYTESHPTHYEIHYIFYTKEDTQELNYKFTSTLDRGLYLYESYKEMGHLDIKVTLDWFYMYKLTNLTLKNHKITKTFFSEEDLEYSIKQIE